LMDIYYPSNFGCFDKTGVFQQPQAFALKMVDLALRITQFALQQFRLDGPGGICECD